MSANATRTLWKVRVMHGDWEERFFEGYFTNKQAAERFLARWRRSVDQRKADSYIEPVEAYRTSGRALADAEWPFEELRTKSL